MKYTTAILTLAAAVSAQDISVFPECSLPCIVTAVGTTSCAATDFSCVCKNMDAIKTAATPCVVDKCGVDVALSASPTPSPLKHPQTHILLPPKKTKSSRQPKNSAPTSTPTLPPRPPTLPPP